MDVRKSFSRLKKKLEHPWSKRKPDRTGTDSGGESLDPAGSLSRPASYAVAGDDHSREDGVDADGQQICPTDKPLPLGVPDPAPVHGGDDDQEGGGTEGGVDGWGESLRHSRPDSDIGVVAGGGPSREGNGADGEKVGQVHPSQSTPSIPRSGTPNGA